MSQKIRPTISRPLTLDHPANRTFSESNQQRWPLRLARRIYNMRSPVLEPKSRAKSITIVCISDTHNERPEIPEGDILLPAGDLTQKGSFREIQDQIDWLDSQSHPFKIAIAGNHDLLLDSNFVDDFPDRIVEDPGASRSYLDWKSVNYLQDNSFPANFPSKNRQIKIYGCPWTSQFGTWAFQFPPIRDVFKEKVPLDADILLTHGPPRGHLNTILARGCQHLNRELCRLGERKTTLKAVVFGHNHPGYGTEDVRFDAVQCLYEDVRFGAGCVMAVMLMVFWVATEWLKWLLGQTLRQSGHGSTMRLVNAAVAPDGTGITKKPIVFQI